MCCTDLVSSLVSFVWYCAQIILSSRKKLDLIWCEATYYAMDRGGPKLSYSSPLEGGRQRTRDNSDASRPTKKIAHFRATGRDAIAGVVYQGKISGAQATYEQDRSDIESWESFHWRLILHILPLTRLCAGSIGNENFETSPEEIPIGSSFPVLFKRHRDTPLRIPIWIDFKFTE